MNPIYTVDVIRDSVSRMSARMLEKLQEIDPLILKIRFEYGHINDINKRLLAYQNNREDVGVMVLLIEDYRNRHGQEGLTGIADLKVILVRLNQVAMTREQRESTTFRPVLYPMYYEFLRQLKISGKFQIYDETKIAHEHINRPHWGDPALYGNKEYPLKGVYDAIELNFTDLKTYLDNCL